MVKEPNGENEWTSGGPGLEEDGEIHPHHHHYSDGSVENDLPMKQLSELFNVNHFIVSQVRFLSCDLYLDFSIGQCSFGCVLNCLNGDHCLAPSIVWSFLWIVEILEVICPLLGELRH